MLRFKPITLIALDPYTAAFCEKVRLHLERDFGDRGSLLQSCALTADGKTSLGFVRDLSSVADFGFDLATTRQGPKRMQAAEAQAAFEASVANLEPLLNEMLESGRRATEIAKARQAGIEIVRNRMVYLLVSSTDTFANGTVIELARLIRWVFTTRFAQELYSLHAVILLPDLFEQAQHADYAAAYALLKKLDHSISSGLTITAQRKMQPFDGCWLIDGINSRGDKIGTLAEELESYSDAFAGFLTAEPEMSGALSGTRRSRGKFPAYSTFGHSELYFPAAIAVKRLSSALARDIIEQTFLGGAVERSASDRRLLLSAKQFVLSSDYRSAIERLESDQGALIWSDFPRLTQLKREGGASEYVSEVQRRHAEFERESLPKFKQALVTSSEIVLSVLVKLLDVEIDRRIDERPGGLEEAPELLQRLVDYSISLHANALGERPQNVITELMAAEASLDPQLGIDPDNSQTEALLKEVNELRSRLADLEITQRLTNAPAGSESQAAVSDALRRVESATPMEGTLEGAQPEQQSLSTEINETRSQIGKACSDYERALIQEERVANQMRFGAKEKAREARSEAVAAAEEVITKAEDNLSKAKFRLEELQEQRRRFLIRHFVIYPALGSLLLIIPALASLVGIWPGLLLVEFFVGYLFFSLLTTLVIAGAYVIAVLYSFMTGINRSVNECRDRVDSLELSLKAARVRLIEARNHQLRLEYDIYAQGMRVETLNKLIQTMGLRLEELRRTMSALQKSRDNFAAEHQAAQPPSSFMRRPVLTAADIDGYYQKLVPSVAKLADMFIREQMPRSLVRHMPIEDFQTKLEAFTRSRFESLGQLSIEDVLLREPDLVSHQQASLQLHELDSAAAPLVLLSELEADDGTFAQRDVTIWAGTTEREPLLNRYREINPATTIRPSENQQTLRTLTRCLNFPAFFISQIEFYRSCYERSQHKDCQSLPDLVPDELLISSEVRRAYECLFLAIATGLIAAGSNGQFVLVKGNQSLGENRRQIAERLAGDYALQKVYVEISAHVTQRSSDSETIYKLVTDLMQAATDLVPLEEEILSGLLRKHHPLR
jgi:hypothetical protein